MKTRELLRILEKDGWYQVKSKGHVQYKHDSKPGRVTVPGHTTLKKGTVRSILKQAGLLDEK
ncbi:MAG: type II toxin-antitoxin system HicA family toxin [Nitrospinaceae bacterium]